VAKRNIASRGRRRSTRGVGQLRDWETNTTQWNIAPFNVAIGTDISARILTIQPTVQVGAAVVPTLGDLDLAEFQADIYAWSTVTGNNIQFGVGLYQQQWDTGVAAWAGNANALGDVSREDFWLGRGPARENRVFTYAGLLPGPLGVPLSWKIPFRLRNFVLKEGKALCISYVCSSASGANVTFSPFIRWRIRRYA